MAGRRLVRERARSRRATRGGRGPRRGARRRRGRALLVDGQPERREATGVRPHAGRPDERPRRDASRRPRAARVAGPELGERRRDPDVDAPRRQLACRVVAEPASGSPGGSRAPRRRAPSAAARRAARGSGGARRERGPTARRAPRRPRSPAPTKTKVRCAPASAGEAAALAASSWRSTWFRRKIGVGEVLERRARARRVRESGACARRRRRATTSCS